MPKDDYVINLNYKELACGIVAQAAKDYKKILRRIKKGTSKPGDYYNQLKLEKFFRSNWFDVLCDLDGEDLIQKMKLMIYKE